ncbi:MAG TPA: aspartate dehydrogenase [Methanothrix sp.]|uniref:aspartate dehydrogenase n=1 Tax=Methanothrix sp. TaxID=90426 RepID=UPI002C8A77D8|nr:aspartate dehydrogenase [Methanothrix sp.]HON35781.1 aspartate dehydrogenase [Methanothrix sp.]HRU75293.1 aspartate dehydrogenase [Methanothrix sp.]
MPLKVGLVGCGAIGAEIAGAIDSGMMDADLVSVFDHNPQTAIDLIASLQHRPKKSDLDELVELSDVVVEAASQRAVPAVARAALSKGRRLMIMSVGALADPVLFTEIKELAKSHSSQVYIPSGAISGLDALKSARSGRIERVTLTTTKNPNSLRGAPFILENGIDLDALTGPREIFSGSAIDAVRAFPANVNVAATLYLAAGEKEVLVRVVADPDIRVNRHEIEVEGDFGRLYTRVDNVPSPRNPKTSHLAALSAISTLRSISEPVKIGT